MEENVEVDSNIKFFQLKFKFIWKTIYRYKEFLNKIEITLNHEKFNGLNFCKLY